VHMLNKIGLKSNDCEVESRFSNPIGEVNIHNYVV
jgi:hypothetical protein